MTPVSPRRRGGPWCRHPYLPWVGHTSSGVSVPFLQLSVQSHCHTTWTGLTSCPARTEGGKVIISTDKSTYSQSALFLLGSLHCWANEELDKTEEQHLVEMCAKFSLPSQDDTTDISGLCISLRGRKYLVHRSIYFNLSSHYTGSTH